MWRRRTTFVRQVLVGLDTLVSVLSYLAALRFRDVLARPEGELVWNSLGDWAHEIQVPPLGDPTELRWLLVWLVPLWLGTFSYCRTGDLRSSALRMMGRYVRAVGIGFVGLTLIAFLSKLDALPRTLVLLQGAFQLVSLILVRLAVSAFARWRRRGSDNALRVIIVGTGAEAVTFAASLAARAAFNVRVIGHVEVPGEPRAEAATTASLGDLVALERILDSRPVDMVAFAVPWAQPEAFQEAISACDQRGVAVMVSLPPEVPRSATLEVTNVTGFNQPMLGLRRTPTGELRLTFKRLMDLAGGLTGLTIAGPIMLLTALAIRLDSAGPILFRQTRVGRNGRTFTMFKFRSMVVDAEKRKAELLKYNEMGGPVFKMRRDPRITRVGRFIRKTSIDELPQLLNIVLGDMSMVGPRPPLPQEVRGYKSWQRRRLSVKPGLTGLWQVSGRNQIDFEEWMKLDLQYIDNWSLWLDIKIILKTFPVVLLQRGSS